MSLPIPVRRALREPFEELHADAAWKRRQLRDRSSPATRWGLGLLGTALVAALALLVARLPREAGPLHLSDGSLPGELVGEARYGLDDGSSIALGAGARIETLENQGHAVELLLSSGEATFDVTPGGPRRWTIDCGLATVTVVGTRFSIDRMPTSVRVSVAHGVVLVHADLLPEGARRLTEGESVLVEAVRAEATLETATPPAGSGEGSPAIVEPETVAAAPTDERPSRARVAAPGWRELARETRYDDAYAALGRGGVESETGRASVEELLMLADVARLSGHPAEAVGPLERLMADHPGDPQAALAAFTLGTVEAGSLRHPDRAAAAFERALELGITRGLAADALSRLATARRDAGDESGAREAAARYLAEHPDGPRAAAMAAIIGTGDAPP